ncbi:hypothetical protein HK104_007429, partial [Borealophlyctis nickersoniae]
EQLHARVASAVDEIVRWVESQGAEKDKETETDILLVTHAAGMIGAVRALIGNPAASVNCGVASLAVLKRRPNCDKEGVVGNWVLEKNGDASYLTNGLQYNWAFWDDRMVEKGAGEDVEKVKETKL